MKMMNVPNLLTLIRVGLIPIFVIVFYLPWKGAHILSALIFTLAAVTDWLDGYLARVLKQTSAFGKFLDPVADKLMVAVALVLIVGQYQGEFEITLAIPAAIIVGREIVISALREWMAEIGKSRSVAVSFLGKVKTTFQMIALIILLAQPVHFFQGILINLGILLLWLAALLTLWSMVIYLRAAHQELRNMPD
jgi:CDP-diacylglycerol--glycerol-3-phosphate 3-phosphatidyltransferase